MSYTNRSRFPRILPEVKTQYCFFCASASVTKKNGVRLEYVCAECGKRNGRVLIYDPLMMQTFDRDGNLIHSSAGLFLVNEKKEILLFLRRKYPYLYTIPAGHLTISEDPKEAAIRETREEVGILVPAAQLLFEGLVYGDKCLGGADIHFWHLYMTHVEDTSTITLNDEGSKWGWFPLSALPEDTTFPVGYFLHQETILTQLRS